MDSDVKERLIAKLNDRELKAVMDELFLDDTVDLVEEMPASVVKRVLAQSDKETRAYINEILKYPKDSAGSIMTIEFVALHPSMTVDDAFERIRNHLHLLRHRRREKVVGACHGERFDAGEKGCNDRRDHERKRHLRFHRRRQRRRREKNYRLRLPCSSHCR